MPTLHGRRRGFFGLISLLVALSACNWALAQVGGLDEEVTRALSLRKLGMARVGISVVDMDTGAALAAVHANEPFTPASNMKLLTSGAATLGSFDS